MKQLFAMFVVALAPAIATAQYDYNNDLTEAVNSHYPPLVRLLITKGAKQNTQDRRGDTPLMLSIRSGDTEITNLLSNYQPDFNLQNIEHHSAAIEAVLADDADGLKLSLARTDLLQVAEATALAKRLKRRRAYGMMSEILGAAGADEIGTFGMQSILRYVVVGSTVSYAYSPPISVPEMCARPTTIILFQGQVCRLKGGDISVNWTSLTNLNNDEMGCSQQRHFRIERKTDSGWNDEYLGECGVAPMKFTGLPNTFDYRSLVIPELLH